ncbi:hypothetical protein N7462_006647 [Penicillium macrosclerotiorum]|uniref:uncharacterized protein n=1 Tax=Penicillium macrosclerotiorum TaxID=303699 RepID=UPI00254770AF|nr:uncharacterized protein N7462_006647 [Penicillium macrosclerotiorum]KAJ5683482.1 hypothetical protein N7462_006647 [Penicillium macrosclerotiorum]
MAPFALITLSTIIASTLAGLINAASDNRTCYHLDGSEASGHVPCTTNDVTNCCDSSAVCLSNGLCLLQGNTGLSFGRATCSSKDWETPSCFAPCNQEFRNGGLPISLALWNSSDSLYCCGRVMNSQNGDLTCHYGSPFTLSQTNVLDGVAYLANNTSNSTSNGNSSTTPTDISSGTESDTPNSESTTASGGSSSSQRDIAIGVGVGVPLGILALASVAWALWERRRFSQLKSSSPRLQELGLLELSHRSAQPVELSAASNPSELMGSIKDIKEHEPPVPLDRREQ